jgi:hypothetical protein
LYLSVDDLLQLISRHQAPAVPEGCAEDWFRTDGFGSGIDHSITLLLTNQYLSLASRQTPQVSSVTEWSVRYVREAMIRELLYRKPYEIDCIQIWKPIA